MRKIGELTTHDFRKALKVRYALNDTHNSFFSQSFPKETLDLPIH